MSSSFKHFDFSSFFYARNIILSFTYIFRFVRLIGFIRFTRLVASGIIEGSCFVCIFVDLRFLLVFRFWIFFLILVRWSLRWSHIYFVTKLDFLFNQIIMFLLFRFLVIQFVIFGSSFESIPEGVLLFCFFLLLGSISFLLQIIFTFTEFLHIT